jgi:hypothetical protein
VAKAGKSVGFSAISRELRPMLFLDSRRLRQNHLFDAEYRYFKEILLVWKQEHFDGYTNFIYIDSQHLFAYNYNFENSTEQKISIRWS